MCVSVFLCVCLGDGGERRYSVAREGMHGTHPIQLGGYGIQEEIQ